MVSVQYPYVGFVTFAFTEYRAQRHHRHAFFQERAYIGREADAARKARFYFVQGMVESRIVDRDGHRDTGTVCRYVEILLQFGVEDVPAVGVEFYAETLVFGAEQVKVSVGDSEFVFTMACTAILPSCTVACCMALAQP